MIVAGALAMAVASALSSAAPAQADEPGQFCFLSSGSISAPSPVPFGQFLTVQWSASTDLCYAPVYYLEGPQFGGFSEPLGNTGSRQVRAIPNGTTMTWTLYVVDLGTDDHRPSPIATKTITVP